MDNAVPSRSSNAHPYRRNRSDRGRKSTRGRRPYSGSAPTLLERLGNDVGIKHGANPITAGAVQGTSTQEVEPSRAPSPVGISQTRFSDFVQRGRISPMLLANNPYEFCTEVQAATMDVILDGVDVMARAKTGTGKTLAFLLPAIQRHLLEAKGESTGPSILVLSPTRELAVQIEKEAHKVIGGSTWKSQIAVGGTNINTEVRRMQQKFDLLVATPGRLLDHLQNRDLAAKFNNLRCLVLDEADRLLDQGFRMELEKIAKFLPRDNHPRQTLLFSATISPEVQNVARLYLSPQHEFISTVKESDESTHAHVKQEYLILDADWHLPALAKSITDAAQADPNTKIICFFTTAKATALAAATVCELISSFDRMLNVLHYPQYPVDAIGPHTIHQLGKLNLPIPLFEIHSRLSQSARTKATKGFTEGRSGVLLSSDVTARGIDIPGISLVIQIGLPANAEQYVHRLGRTARAGTEGSGLLILAPWEQRFLANKHMVNIPIKEREIKEDEVKLSLASLKEAVDATMMTLEDKVRCSAYQAMLGYYAGNLRAIGISQPSLLLVVNQYAKLTLRWQLNVEGKNGLPPITRKVVGKMPLQKPLLQQELNLVHELPFGE